MSYKCFKTPTRYPVYCRRRQ